MKLKNIISSLKLYNKWRRGKITFNVNPKAFGLLIDEAIVQLERQKSLSDWIKSEITISAINNPDPCKIETLIVVLNKLEGDE